MCSALKKQIYHQTHSFLKENLENGLFFSLKQFFFISLEIITGVCCRSLIIFFCHFFVGTVPDRRLLLFIGPFQLSLIWCLIIFLKIGIWNDPTLGLLLLLIFGQKAPKRKKMWFLFLLLSFLIEALDIREELGWELWETGIIWMELRQCCSHLGNRHSVTFEHGGYQPYWNKYDL